MGRQLDIGIFIQERLHHLGLAQGKLAAKLDVAFLTVNLWGNNREMPSPVVMEKIQGMLRSLLNSSSVTLREVANSLVNKYSPREGA